MYDNLIEQQIMKKTESKPKVKKELGKVNLTVGIKVSAVPEVECFGKSCQTKMKSLVENEGLKTKKALQFGEVEIIISNSGVDRHGESITMEGIDTKQVMRNRVVLWGHQYGELPIGQILRIWRSKGNLMARVKLDYDIDDFADKIYKKIIRGSISAVSIGGIVKEWDQEDPTIISKLEMIEVSFVSVGAHPDALVTAKSLDKLSGLDNTSKTSDNEIRLHIEVLKNLIVALESNLIDSKKTAKKTAKKKKKSTKPVKLPKVVRQIDSNPIIAAINNKLK